MPDNGCEVVVVGASAGGVEALSGFVHALPADFPAPIVVVLHIPSTGPSLLPEILHRAGRLPVSHATHGEALQPGHVYVAPPDCHLLVEDGRLRLTRGPRENGHRPAIDALFRSAADAYGSQVAAVVLSGMLDDGTLGLYAVKQAGGATLVQDPEEALYASMPTNAIAYAQPDYVMPIRALTNVLIRLTAGGNGAREPGPRADVGPAPDHGTEVAQAGEIMAFACPECGGTLWETRASNISRYRCRIGHSYTTASLAAAHGETVERVLWTAHRVLGERAVMSRRVARRLADRDRGESAARFRRQADASETQAAELKAILDGFEPAPDSDSDPK